LQLLSILREVRQDHPKLSCRQIYYMLRPTYMGRDQFERFCYSWGFKVPRNKRYYRTTDSFGVNRFPNLLLKTDEITGINQIWVSDITYYQLSDKVYYITLIMDLYSRKIVGWNVSDTLRTEETTLKALTRAIKDRSIPRASNLIIHSDGGGQYYSKEFKNLTNHYGMRNSMCACVYENPHAERINGTIKNDYLIPFSPDCYSELTTMLEKTIFLYNHQRPHQALDRCPPAEFENRTLKGSLMKTWIINKKKTTVKTDKIQIRVTSN
jgi:putative transposase